MKRRIVAAALAVLGISSSQALAWDPFREERRLEPAAPEASREPDPAPFIAPPPDIYYVTDTYVADVVNSSGLVTTYSTSTIHESTGSYARVLDTVGTGAWSAFDGSAFNGRRALSDGRLVAGTYYENYVLTTGGFVPVSVVFFQDDAELARLLGATSAPRATPTAPTIQPLSSATTRPIAPSCCATQPSVGRVAQPTPTPPPPIHPVISLLPSTAPLGTVEVLRGRAVSLFLRAFIDGREVPVRSWRVIAGDAGDAVAAAGSGGEPFRSSWRRLAQPGAAYEVVFRIDVDLPGAGHGTADASISVIVRSPALED